MEINCDTCAKREECKKPCQEVVKLLWADNRIMERHYIDRIVCYPRNGEVHFTELEERQIEDFSTDDVIPWSSEDLRLRKTTVFVERFFNKVPCKVLADKFGVKENTIVCMYKQAVEQIEKLIEVLDSRREGIKAMKPDIFSDDQKYFLLCCIFGFSQAEVARMFGKDKDMVNKKVKRLRDKYEELFESKKNQPVFKSAYEGLSISEIQERMAL